LSALLNTPTTELYLLHNSAFEAERDGPDGEKLLFLMAQAADKLYLGPVNPAHAKEKDKEGPMNNLLPVLMFLATVSAFSQGAIAVELPSAADVSGAGNAVVLVGGMGGGAAGGMGGMTGGTMGGMTGGAMGGMSGGMGGMSGGMNAFGGTPSNGSGSTYGGADPTSGGSQPGQYYLCVTPYDRCSLASSPGSLRSGSSCTCSTGHRGTIK
jgi:hypothetical protein